MTDAYFSLPFTAADLQLRTLENASLQLRCSRAFVRLCVSAGCPTRSGRLSAAELLHWLFGNYCRVRELSGLVELPSLENVPPASIPRHQMANAVITLADFGMSRSSFLNEKRHLNEMRQTMRNAINRD